MKYIALWVMITLCCANLYSTPLQKNTLQKVHLSVRVDTVYKHTGIQLFQYNEIISGVSYASADRELVPQKNRQSAILEFDIPVDKKYTYIFLRMMFNNDAINLIFFQTIIAGDSISLHISSMKDMLSRQLNFSGDHADFYNCQGDISSTIKFSERSSLNADGMVNKDFLKKGVSYLESNKQKLDKELYAILLADYVGRIISEAKNEWAQFINRNYDSVTDSSRLTNIKRSITEVKKLVEGLKISDPAKVYSAFYAAAIADLEFCLARAGRTYSGNYASLLKLPYQPLKEKALICFLYRWVPWLGDSVAQHIMKDLPSHIKSTKYTLYIDKYMSANSVGKPAYNFSLPDVSGKYHQLSDFKGKVVFIDFFFLGCGACSDFFIGNLAEVEKKFHGDTNVVFITVCVSSREDWIKAIESGIYTSDMALNLYTDGKEYKHEIISYYTITSYPKPMLIGKDGKIFSVSDKDLRNKATLEKLLHAAKGVS